MNITSTCSGETEFVHKSCDGNFPAKFNGETESVPRSWDVRSRDIKVFDKYSEQNSLLIVYVTSVYMTSIFSPNLAGKLSWCTGHVTSIFPQRGYWSRV